MGRITYAYSQSLISNCAYLFLDWVLAGFQRADQEAQKAQTTVQANGTASTGSVSTPISLAGKMVIPSGSSITGTAREAKKAGRFKGGAVLALTVDSITVHGHQYDVETEAFSQTATGKGKWAAGAVVGGTGVGAGNRWIGWRRQGSSHRDTGRSLAWARPER